MKRLVSIIIPIYNTAPYLKACLSGVLQQTYRHIEVILVNDGSTDDSANICKEYAKKDARIHLVNIANRGVSHARNVGLDRATGEYITFIDSDDIISTDYVSSLLQCAVSNDDIVCCNIVQWNPENNVIVPFPGTSNSHEVLHMDSDVAIENMLRNRLISSGPYAKLISRKVIGRERFSKLIIAEDLEFNFRIFSHVNKIIYCDNNIYKYRQTSTGAMRKPFAPSRMDAVSATQLILESAIKNKKNYIKAARYRLLRAALHCAGSIIDSGQKRIHKKFYLQCQSLIRRHAPLVATDSGADLRMRVVSTMAAINLPISWKLTTSWHKVDVRLKSIKKPRRQ